MKRVHVIVRGDVQGVGYRYTARLEADRLGVSGWVRNRRDGRVEAEVEGEAAAVEEMLDWMRQGPPGSRVDELTTADSAPVGDSAFEVRSTG
ncbi:acylphosphatase [Microbacterium lushaniae]|nr:acylphosphatase [Microbacterium lushaniae]KAA9155731.1 acylphosphatase [Microbacterium lushaniae]